MKKQDKIPGLTTEGLALLRELNKKQQAGEKIDSTSKDALDALSVASRIMNTIMNGGQVDPAYIKHLISEYSKKLNSESIRPTKIIRKKKLKLRKKA